MGQTAGKPHHFSTLLHHLFKAQTEHLLHEYELDDETLQKAQLEQHKIFQNFPTSPAPAAPNAPSLPAGTNPKSLLC